MNAPNKMNLKTPKKRKIAKFRYFIYLILIYLSFAFAFYTSMQNNNKINNEEFINFLLNGGNLDKFNDFKLANVVNKTMQAVLNIDFTNPISLLNNSIFASNNTLDNTKKVNLDHNDDYSNLEELKKVSEYIEDPNPVDEENPIVYIYNTHQLENYNSKNLDIYGITPNVLMASYILKEKLNKLGIPTIVEDTNISDFLNINGWDYSSSYKATRLLILDKKNKYSSLKYFIDLHRDSVNKDITTTNIDGKSYAKILFVIGLEHENYEENIKTASDINDLINKYYPTLSRGIYKKEGAGVDGIYNQDLSGNSILIELGGVDNNIEEVFNTIEALSKVLNYYINGEKDE